ncbi:hypothetical protein BD309DRAFT_981885 [Dichomitus squalens]|nr:hypothetical protein BD309DRAFT_981885 [Dichomitus squalens]
MPKIPPVYSRSRINETKETTQSELSFDGKDIINYIVYRPAFLDSLDQDGKKLLMDIRLNRDNVHHMGFLHLVLPEYATCLLSRSIFSEKDVVDWWMLTIFRPAFLFLRWVIIATDLGGARDCMKDVNPLSDEPQWHYPNMCSSKSDKFIPDGLLVNDITIINGIRQPDVIICSFEVKSQQAWGAELFAELTQMPQQISIDAAHTHRFGWPHSPLETAKSKLNRMLIQVWSHLVKRGAHVAFLTCHTRTIVMKRVDNMLYLSREYMYDEDLPVFTVFSVLAFECGLIKSSKPKMPRPDLHKVQVALDGHRPMTGVDLRAMREKGILREADVVG